MRDNNTFKIALVNTNANKVNITYDGHICWNNLPIHIPSYSILVLTNFFHKLIIQYHVISVKNSSLL